MKQLLLVFLLFAIITCSAYADQIANDLKKLERIISLAYENLSLDPENESEKISPILFLQTAELKLKFAELSEGLHNFLDQDYLNLGMYLLSLKMKKADAALKVLQGQLEKEKEARVRSWLKDRIIAVNSISEVKNPEIKWKELTLSSELKRFERLFR